MVSGFVIAGEEVSAMSERVELDPVDRVEITTLYENLVDMTMPGGGPVKRLTPKAGKIVSTLLAEEKGIPFVGGHGLSMLVRVMRNDTMRSLLFDTGGSPEGLVHNLDCLELNPRDWNCIVLSHGPLGSHLRSDRFASPPRAPELPANPAPRCLS